MAQFITFKPTEYCNPMTYIGNGTTSTTQTGVGFSADLTWIKSRDSVGGAQNWECYDTVRGATYTIHSNSTGVQETEAQGLQSWTSDGFVVGTQGGVNTNLDGYSSYNWKMGTTSGITTNGSTTITPSSYSFNQAAGQSIIKFTAPDSTGAFPHGLGKRPDLVIVKHLGSVAGWPVQSIGMQVNPGGTNMGNYYMKLDHVMEKQDSATMWNDTEADATNVFLGTSAEAGGGTDNVIAWCFASIPGYSSFGRYVGQANVDGPFISTDFRPTFFMNKYMSGGGTGGWIAWSDAMGPGGTTNSFNPNTATLALNSNASQVSDTTESIDFLSNGIKIRTTSGVINGLGDGHLYAAFAEFPFVGKNENPGVAK